MFERVKEMEAIILVILIFLVILVFCLVGFFIFYYRMISNSLLNKLNEKLEQNNQKLEDQILVKISKTLDENLSKQSYQNRPTGMKNNTFGSNTRRNSFNTRRNSFNTRRNSFNTRRNSFNTRRSSKFEDKKRSKPTTKQSTDK